MLDKMSTTNLNGNSTHSQTAIVDPAFQPINKKQPGFFIWRVENMQLNTVPKETYGLFYKGDTYLIYSNDSNKTQHIHLWIGSESTTDEQGIGAYKMVELDDYLGGLAIQHRECQNYESERFLNYFKQKGGMKYLNGGAACGLNHFEKKLDARLFQIRGKRNVRLNELYNMEWSALNRNDSFLIDLGSTLFVWNGRNANKYEKLQAMNKARQFRDERNGECNIVIVEDGEEKDLPKTELKLFESKFPLKEKVSKLKNDTTNGQDEVKFDKDTVSYLKLYKCCDARDDEDGTVKIKIIEQKTGPLYKEDLNSEDSFIVDNGKTGIWVWIGKRSSHKERQEAMRNALGFLQAKGFDERQQNLIKVTRVIDGCEPVEFKALFNRWPENNESKGLGRTYNINTIAKTIQTKFDSSVLHANHQLAAESQMLDDGKGLKEIYYVQNFDIHKLDESKFGEFYSGDCYIIHYKYSVNEQEKHIIYYWIGKKATADEKGTVALKTIELDNNSLEGKALQVRVIEGKEPNHFMALFNGKIIIYQGGKATGFHNHKDSKTIDKLPDNYMLQIKSFGPNNMKAIQVDFKATSLNTNDVFVICHETSNFYVWCGKGSTGDERETAKQIVSAYKKEPDMVFESQEKDDFWNALGGKQAYHSDKRLQYNGQMPIARLFELYNASGKITVNEIYDFNQNDLNPNEVMILDAWDTVFIWFGSESNKQERDESEKIVFDYLKSDPSQRGVDIPIFKIKQGIEPPNFTGFFGPWDPEYTKSEDDYNDMKQELHSKNQPHLFQTAIKEKLYTNGNGLKQNSSTSSINFSQYPKYPYEQLVKPVEELPDNVLSEFKELHLTDDDFQKIFKMSYQEFKEKPSWKQKDLKRFVRLF